MCHRWHLGQGLFLRTELARPGYSLAISSNCSSTTVVAGAAFSPSSLPLLPFASEALSLSWEVSALVWVQALAVSAFTVYGCSADKCVAPAPILFRT